MTNPISTSLKAAALGASALIALAGMASADQVILDDLIVDGSACIGFDCVNGESFGFDTLRLKENNTRIKFDDTSVSASFPRTDWQLTANDTTNGGAEKFSIDDITNSRTPFTIRATAPSNSIFVDSSGRLGLKTANPVADIHARTGNTPTLRLEQDGSSGFTPQTWDVAGNEANFFVRDASNGSTLPFRIQPGAPSNAIYTESTGDIGIGAGTNPEAPLHVKRTGATKSAILVEAATGDAALELKQVGATAAQWEIRNQAGSGRLNIGLLGGNTPIKIDDLANDNLLRVGLDGEPDVVSVTGTIKVNSTALNVPDYVFEEGYALRPLSEVAAFIADNGHLPGVLSATQINGEGSLDLIDMQLTLLEKVEELTLYTLAQEDRIAALTAKIEGMEAAD